MKETGAAFWQKIARHYTSMMKHSAPLYREICNRIRRRLTRDMNVLELACGTGQLSVPLSPHVRLWEATDFSPSMIAEAKKRAASSRLHFSVQDAVALPYAPETFDAVVIANALHILPEPDKVMAEIRRVLKPGGWLFAPTFVHGGGRLASLRTRCMERTGFRVYHHWNAGEFISYLSQQGFWVVEQALLGSRALPLCYIACRWTPPEYLASQPMATAHGYLRKRQQNVDIRGGSILKPWRSIVFVLMTLALLTGCGTTDRREAERASLSPPEEPAVTEGFPSSADSTWGDLFRRFDPEGFSALPEEVQAEYDRTLLTEQSPQFVIKENGAWVFKWQP